MNTLDHPLQLYNSLARSLGPFVPIEKGRARVYSCGPTVYSFQHIGNLRAYVFTDTLSRILSYKGYDVTHIINITDVGHLTSDADSGDDKMEKAAVQAGRSAQDIARFYTEKFWRDIDLLNVRHPMKWALATEHIEEMIAFAQRIASEHCYELDSGLYFDVTTVPHYGTLARPETRDGDSRIDPIKGKRHPADFAIWRKSAPGENRQMEWASPWGRGAPGWHLECSVMSMKYLGEKFDIHTGGIDHREIHHPNEIAQNQAYTCSRHPGANFWLHNNFLIDRVGKMSKSTGEFLILDKLIERGYHPMAFRLLCLCAHYRSDLEFSFDNLSAALTRLKRMVISISELRGRAGDATPASLAGTEKDVLARFDEAVSTDLMTPRALPVLEELIASEELSAGTRLSLIKRMDDVLGLNLLQLERLELRIRPIGVSLMAEEVEYQLELRRAARVQRNFAEADTIRTALVSAGIEIMDGDPLAWEWSLKEKATEAS